MLLLHFDYVIRDCRLNPDLVSAIFVQSGYADRFERGNPAVIAGMSGVEPAREVILHAHPIFELLKKVFCPDRSA